MKAPAFQFYAGDYLSSSRVTLMTLEEEGAYVRLLCHCWLSGSIPKDPEQIARLIGKGASTTLASNVATMFQADGCRLLHDKLNALRAEREQWLEKSRKGGLASAAKRAKQKEIDENESKGGCNLVDDCLQPNGNTSTSTPTSNRLTHSGEIPAKQEVIDYAGQIGLVEWRAEDWWLDMEAKGWIYKGDVVVNWKAFLTRVKTWWESDGRPMERKANGSAVKTTASMPLWKRIEVLTSELEKHPGNPDSTYCVSGDKKARAEFKQLKIKLRELKDEEKQNALS